MWIFTQKWLIKSTKNPLKSSSDFLNRYCNIKIIILSLIISFYQKYTNNENQRIFFLLQK